MTPDDLQSSGDGTSYKTWKGWSGDEFGGYDARESHYFKVELARTGLDLSRPMRVLEVGFGNGNFLNFARERKWSIAGTEAIADLVNAAREHSFDARPADQLSTFDPDSFDLVVAFDVLEHIPAEAVDTFLKEIRTLLKPEGRFLARFPNGDSPFGLAYQNGDMTHVAAIGAAKIEQYCRTADMKIVFIGGDAEPILGMGMKSLVQRAYAVPIKRAVNFFVRAVYFPTLRVEFSSRNLVAVMKRA